MYGLNSTVFMQITDILPELGIWSFQLEFPLSIGKYLVTIADLTVSIFCHYEFTNAYSVIRKICIV